MSSDLILRDEVLRELQVYCDRHPDRKGEDFARGLRYEILDIPAYPEELRKSRMPRPDDGKFFELHGSVEVPFSLSFDEFCRRVMAFTENNGWYYAGYFEDAGEVKRTELFPLRHARWEYDEERDALVCSECREVAPCNPCNTDYCPHCGSLMDAKEEPQ